jgi:DNA polymerase III epsilon subunit-like protein
MRCLFFDTETTGLPLSWGKPVIPGVWPDLVSIAWVLTDEIGTLLSSEYHIIRPDGWNIPLEASNIHKITTEIALEEGRYLSDIIQSFMGTAMHADLIVAHNMNFDQSVIDNAIRWRLGSKSTMQTWGKRLFCTMKHGTAICKLPGRGPYQKRPKLIELYQHAFGSEPTEVLHNALNDTNVLKNSFFKLWNPLCLPVDREVIGKNAVVHAPQPSKLVLSLAEDAKTV